MKTYEQGTAPICYLDVDGVIYWYAKEDSPYFFGSYSEVRPWLFAFLTTVHDLGFDLRLLTCNDRGGKATMEFVDESGTHQLHRWELSNIPTCYRVREFHNGLNATQFEKAAYIDLNRPFVWIEDGIIDVEKMMLAERGWTDRYFYVDPHVPDEFLRAIPWLKTKAQEFGLIEDAKTWVKPPRT
jgi:hypothetical protein